MCAIKSKPYGWDLRKKTKLVQKTQKGHLWTIYIFSKVVQALETIFTAILHHISLWHHVCN